MIRALSTLSRLNLHDDERLVPEAQMGTEIPRLIHQTFANRALPAPLEENVDRLRAANPGWRHTLYDDAGIEAFIADAYGDEMLGRYRRINPVYGAARADLFRYLLLYRRGGVYLDIKSNTRVPLDSLLRPDDRYLLARWSRSEGERWSDWGRHPELRAFGGELQQWHIVCVPGHPFLRRVIARVLANIERYRPLVDGIGFNGVLRVTGPIAYTLAVAPIVSRHPHRLLDDEPQPPLVYDAVTDGRRPINHYSRQKQPVVRASPLTTGVVVAAVTLKRTLRPSTSS
ncbi:MAG: glycosyltransferase [Alphaproteobacteria bacterium]|nr:glycosyltransferase [Alphaproteobacteria bacterium]